MFRWHTDDDPTLSAGLVAAIFQGIRICIARKPYIFRFFQGDPDPLSPPSLDPHILQKIMKDNISDTIIIIDGNRKRQNLVSWFGVQNWAENWNKPGL